MAIIGEFRRQITQPGWAVCGIERRETLHDAIVERGHRYPENCHHQMQVTTFGIYSNAVFAVFCPQPYHLSGS
jgi:hypothetical protein